VRRRALLLAALATPALAQGRFPDRPIRIIVPFPPGQAVDILARILAERAGALRWSQHRVVVENRPGAGGTIGTATAAQAAPDGHTILFGSLAGLAVNPAIMRSLPYDAERDFAPIIRVFEGALLVLVPAASPHQDLAALLAHLRRGGVTYGSSGPGSTQHVGTEFLLQATGITATHVPYRGSGPALTDLVAGSIEMVLESVTSATPLIRAGQVRALATTSAARLPAFPNVPTVAEAAGLPGFQVLGAGGLLAPARTPQPVIEELHAGFAAAMAEPQVLERFAQLGTVAVSEGPETFGSFLAGERAKWREVARRGNINLE
jgi:tripartite-type tricarboxylate transporter receptor subunit TctC